MTELTGDFVAMLLIGKERGYLTPDDLLSVMGSVELTPEIIATAVARVKAAGIEWRDDTEREAVDLDELVDEVAPGRAGRPARAARARSRVLIEPRREVDTGGSSYDPVRMYLKE